MQIPSVSAAVHNILTAGLSHCKYTYEDLKFIQFCSALVSGLPWTADDIWYVWEVRMVET